MTTISLSVDIHIYLIILIALTSSANLLFLRFENPYKVRRWVRYFLPIFHVFVAANIFTGLIVMALNNLAVNFKYALMIIATVALIGLHIAINKALKWANPKKDDIFTQFKNRVPKIILIELILLLSTTLVTMNL